MSKPLAALLLLAALALPAAASEQAPPTASELLQEGEDIGLAEWRQLVEGRVVWYYIDGRLWGRELYHPGEDRVTFQYRDGECRDATWTRIELAYCFDFRDGPPHCFRHIRRDGRMWAVPVSGDTPQEIKRIDASPMLCEPEAIS